MIFILLSVDRPMMVLYVQGKSTTRKVTIVVIWQGPWYCDCGLGGIDNTCLVVGCWDLNSIFMATLSLDHLASASTLRLPKC